MNHRWNCFRGFVLVSLALVFLLCGQTEAQQGSAASFPTKPITLIVQFSAGGTTDLSARKLASLVEKELGQPIVVENRTGAGGNIGHNAIAKAAPDGYTIGTFAYSGTVIIPHLRSVPFNTREDFSFVMQYCELPQPLGVAKNAQWKTLKELLDWASQHPRELKYSTIGAGSSQNLFMELLAKRENLKFSHIPYKGGADAVTAVIGGHVTACMAAEVAQHAAMGNVRALAVLGEKRLKGLADTPTFDELGYKIPMPLWVGIAGPKGIPAPILNKLEAAFTKAYQDPSFQETLDKLIMNPILRNGSDFKKIVLRDYERGREIANILGLSKEK